MNSLRILRLARPAPVPRPIARPFSTAFALRHGERHGDRHHKSDGPEFEVEKHKQEAIEKQKKGQGQWSPDLASDSEENIKADKSEFDVKEIKEQAKK